MTPQDEKFDWLSFVEARYKGAMARCGKVWPNAVTIDMQIVSALKDVPQLVAEIRRLAAALAAAPQPDPEHEFTAEELHAIASILTDHLEAQKGQECEDENSAFIKPLLRRVGILASRRAAAAPPPQKDAPMEKQNGLDTAQVASSDVGSGAGRRDHPLAESSAQAAGPTLYSPDRAAKMNPDAMGSWVHVSEYDPLAAPSVPATQDVESGGK